MAFYPTGPSLALAMVATTGVDGFTLQDATPTILSWTAPNDGNLHSVNVVPFLKVTTVEVGGAISVDFTDPSNTAEAFTVQAGSEAAGTYGYGHSWTNWNPLPIYPGTTFSLVQSSALTSGAAVLWAQIWAA